MTYKIESTQINISVYISKYLLPVLEKKMTILVFFLIGLFFSIPFLFFIKSEYVSQAALLIEEPRSRMSSEVRDTGIFREKASPAYVITEAEKIKSVSFSLEVLKILPDSAKKDLKYPLDLQAQIRYNILRFIGKNSKALSSSMERDRYIKELENRVSIKSQSHTAMMWITARSLDPDVAPLIVKSYIDVWVAINLEENKRSISMDRKFAEEEKNKVFNDLQQAEKELMAFKTKYEIPVNMKVAPDIELQLELEQLQSNYNKAETRYAALDKIFSETKRKESGVVSNIKVISPPITPTEPSQSKKFKVQLTIILSGLLLGIAMVLTQDYIQGNIRHETDIIESVNLPIIGNIPKL